MKSRKLVIHNGASADGVGETMYVSDLRHIEIAIAATSGTSAVLKIQGARDVHGDRPDFGSAQSATNHWDYIHCYDKNDPQSGIVGGTGITWSAVTPADSTRLLVVNSDRLDYLNVQISSHTAGAISVTAFGDSDVVE